LSFFSEEHQSELKQLFFETAAELLQALDEQGLRLEKRSGDPELVREVRRTVHTLKGDSAACGFQELSSLAHELEDVLTTEIASRSEGALAEIVLGAADVFTAMLSAYREGTEAPSAAPVRELIRQLVAKPQAKHVVPYKLSGRFAWSEYEQMTMTQAQQRGRNVYNIALAVDPHCPMKDAAVQLVRNVLAQLGDILAVFPEGQIASDQLDVIEFAVASSQPAEDFQKKCRVPSVISDVLVEPYEAGTSAPEAERIVERTEKIVEPIDNAQENVPEIPLDAQPSADTEPSAAVSAASKLRVDAERIDAVLNLVGELVIGKSMLMQSIGEFEKRFPKDPLRTKFADAMSFQVRVLNDLQKSVMKIRMVPVEQLFRQLPRIVRDTAKICGKDVGLQISGQDTDLDKSILDVLTEPLSHLVRNAVDHGIESVAERLAAGKPAQGCIRLNAYHQGNQIIIECSDDGRGIDAYKLITKAVGLGVLSEEQAERLPDSEALDLIFHPGLSTAEQVTEISGRGIGMDVVRTVLKQLKGTISIESKPRVGTTFLLKVPLTLAIIKALMFRAADHTYAVPLDSVVEIARVSQSDIHRIDQHEVMQLRDQLLTLVRMSQLAKPGPAGVSKNLFVVVVAIAERKFGLIVDRLVGEEELVIKAMDDHLVATELVSGASILGDGSVVLILNLSVVVARLGRAPAMAEAVGA
jgi:two-component system chemotaxis sensor kinase CheA